VSVVTLTKIGLDNSPACKTRSEVVDSLLIPVLRDMTPVEEIGANTNAAIISKDIDLMKRL